MLDLRSHETYYMVLDILPSFNKQKINGVDIWYIQPSSSNGRESTILSTKWKGTLKSLKFLTLRNSFYHEINNPKENYHAGNIVYCRTKNTEKWEAKGYCPWAQIEIEYIAELF